MKRLNKPIDYIIVATFIVLFTFPIYSMFYSKYSEDSLSPEDIRVIIGCYRYNDQVVKVDNNGIEAKLQNGDFSSRPLRTSYGKRFLIISKFDLYLGDDNRIYGSYQKNDIFITIWGKEWGKNEAYYINVAGKRRDARMKLQRC